MQPGECHNSDESISSECWDTGNNDLGQASEGKEYRAVLQSHASKCSFSLKNYYNNEIMLLHKRSERKRSPTL
jgi:hypothetical protein